MTNSTVHQTVMTRVRAIHALRAVASGVGASAILFVASLYFIGREVWVAHVWENMPSLAHAGAFFNFFTYAFLHTNVIVQALVLITIFAALWLTREFVRVLKLTSPKLAGA